jgi:hypothetical protein
MTSAALLFEIPIQEEFNKLLRTAALLFEIPIQEEFNKLLRNNKDQIEGEAS